MAKIIWVLVNSNSKAEAERIGKVVLSARLAACFGLIKKEGSSYFWPPKTNRLETSKGPLLVLETLPSKYQKIIKLVRSLHGDQVPFIGKLEITGVQKAFFSWLTGEIK